MGQVLDIVTRTIASHLIKAAGYHHATAQTGAVTLHFSNYARMRDPNHRGRCESIEVFGVIALHCLLVTQVL